MPRGNIDSKVETIPANGVLNLTNANFLFLISATAAVTLKFQNANLGSAENISNVLAGLQISRVKPWAFCNISGAAGTQVTLWYGYTDVREDNTIFSQQIAVIAGVTPVSISPSATIATPAALVVATGNKQSIAANLLRRRITVCNLSTNLGSVFIQAPAAGAGIGIELQAGTFVELDTTSAFDLRNDSGAAVTVTTFEET